MTKLDGKTPDLAAENIEQLRQIFPDVFEEGKIDFDKLKQVLGEYVDDEKERYNFTWNGKGKALRLAQTPTTGTLRPCEAESKNWDDTQNLYIEGDNLEVLKLLQKSYHGKIKMIYIDPPYNTGGDFVYPDDFSDSIENYKRITGQVDDEGKRLGTNSEFSGRYHTDWLNMMYPRLRLARNLLRNDGLIFISINENEVVNLYKICDDIFGENNRVATFVWKNKYGPGAFTRGVASLHEYILCYAKVYPENIEAVLSEEEIKNYKLKDEKYTIRGGYITQPLATKSKDDRPNLVYPHSVYDYVVYDSEVERNFAEQLENNESVKVYAKLPDWFKVPTPLGSYNPDWAVVIEDNGLDKLYFVVETKGSIEGKDLRPKEQAKIQCGEKHFAALGNDTQFVRANAFQAFVEQID